jgi:hypothetical protein
MKDSAMHMSGSDSKCASKQPVISEENSTTESGGNAGAWGVMTFDNLVR